MSCSITITADGSLLSNKSGASTITGNGTDGATIVNAGTVRAGINTINFKKIELGKTIYDRPDILKIVDNKLYISINKNI